jgi:hypothetical protein
MAWIASRSVSSSSADLGGVTASGPATGEALPGLFLSVDRAVIRRLISKLDSSPGRIGRNDSFACSSTGISGEWHFLWRKLLSFIVMNKDGLPVVILG